MRMAALCLKSKGILLLNGRCKYTGLTFSTNKSINLSGGDLIFEFTGEVSILAYLEFPSRIHKVNVLQDKNIVLAEFELP